MKRGNAKDKKALAMLIGLYYDAVIGWPEELERRKKGGSTLRRGAIKF